MQRNRKIRLAKVGVITAVVPVLLWAYEYGPNPGYTGVPGENGGATCTASGCHVGKTNDPNNKGSVSVNVGSTYTPGVTQHLTVKIADPATTQRAWGFELTARQASSPSTVAGTLASVDKLTQLMCSQTNLFIFQQVTFSPSSPQSCPTGEPLVYIEHTRDGYTASLGHTGSWTYNFDWTPPSTNVGNIIIYVAGNAVNGDLNTTGDHVYATTYTLTPAGSGPTPAIDATLSVQNQTIAPSAAGQAVAPGSLVAIYGTSFASAQASAASIPLSTTLANVSVTFNGIPAPMVGIAPGISIGGKTVDQINAIVPWAVTLGTASVIVSRSNQPSAAVSIPIASMGPGIFYIATDSGGVNRPLVYNNSDNTFSYPPGIFGSSLNSRPSSIGKDFVVIWCTGLGPVTVTPPDGAPPANAAGQFAESDTLTKPVVLVGGKQANVLFSGLTQYPSIYQVNVTLDPSTPTGDAVPIQIQLNGVTTTDQLKIAVVN